MKKLVNGIYVTVSDLDQTDNLERSVHVQDAHEFVPDIGAATAGGQNASLLSNGKRMFSRAVVRMRGMVADGWNQGTETIPRGHHVILRMRDGSEVQAFRARSMIVYDVRTGGVVDCDQVVAWRKA